MSQMAGSCRLYSHARMRVAVPVGTTLIGLALGILEIRWN